jgi:hypothetical protein
MPLVRAVAAGAAKHNYQFSSLVLGIVESAPFMMKKPVTADAPPKVALAH